MKVTSASRFQAIYDAIPSGDLIVNIDDVFSVLGHYLRAEQSSRTLLALTERNVLQWPTEAIETTAMSNGSVHSKWLVSNDQKENTWCIETSSQPGASQRLGSREHFKTQTLGHFFGQLTSVGIIHLGKSAMHLFEEVLEYAHNEGIAITVESGDLALSERQTASFQIYDDQLNQTNTPNVCDADFMLLVPNSMPEGTEWLHKVVKSIHQQVPSRFLVEAQSISSDRMMTVADNLPKCGFYGDAKDGIVWSRPNVANTLLFRPSQDGRVKLKIHFKAIARDLSGTDIMVVVGTNPLQTVVARKHIELSVNLKIGEVTPLTFLLPTWSYLEDHDRWVGVSVASLEEEGEGTE